MSLKECILSMNIVKSNINNVYNFCDIKTNGKLIDVFGKFIKAEREGYDGVNMTETIIFTKYDLISYCTLTHIVFVYSIPRCCDVVSTFSSDAKINILLGDKFISDSNTYVLDFVKKHTPITINFIFKITEIPNTFYLTNKKYFLTKTNIKKVLKI
jgi:hypothetical protein